jgi:hypothetical protein
MILDFEKEEGKWYVVLPTWTGPKEALQMVAGADVMLDILSNNGSSITLELESRADLPDDWRYYLGFTKNAKEEYGEGAFYTFVDSLSNYRDKTIWLCAVVNFVFGEYPETIYFNVIKL